MQQNLPTCTVVIEPFTVLQVISKEFLGSGIMFPILDHRFAILVAAFKQDKYPLAPPLFPRFFPGKSGY